VDNIKERSKIVHEKGNQLETLKNSFSTDNLADPAPLHEFYQDYFNLVDLVDRYWCEVEEHHHHKQGQTKMILAILRNAVINSWVYGNKSKFETWISWQNTLAEQLLKI